MTALVSIDKALVVRFGKATYQLNRQLDIEGCISLQFENQLTGGFKCFRISEFYSMLEAGVLTPISGNETLGNTANKRSSSVALDLSALSDAAKAEIEHRLTLVRYLRKKGISRGKRDQIHDAINDFEKLIQEKKKFGDSWTKPSPSTVMEWMRRYENSGGNAVALLSGNHFRRRPTEVHELVEDAMTWALKTFYLTRQRFSLLFAYNKLQGRLKELVTSKQVSTEIAKVSLATFQRRRTELDDYTVLSARYGSNYARNELRVTMDGTVATRAMERLEIDHTLLDWVVICDRTGLPLGRPTLTVVVDSFSGYVVGLYLSFNGPNVTSILKVIKNSIRPKEDLVAAAGATKPWIAWGIGDCFLLDNGMEFHSRVFRLAAWELSVDLEYCRVRTPWLKPKVERFFANLNYLTLTHGRVHKPLANSINIDPKKDAAITLSRLCSGLVVFASDILGYTPNSRTLELPAEKYAESLAQSPPACLPVSMAGLDMIAALSKTATIAQGGVDFYGLSYAGYPLKDLINSAGGKFSSIIKWDPDDLGFMHVQHPRTKVWVTLACTRPDYANGLSWLQHKLLRQVARQELKLKGTADHLLAAREMLYEMWMEPLAIKNTSLQYAQAKKFAGQLASAATYTKDLASVSASPEKLMLADKDTQEEQQIPEFETYV